MNLLSKRCLELDSLLALALIRRDTFHLLLVHIVEKLFDNDNLPTAASSC